MTYFPRGNFFASGHICQRPSEEKQKTRKPKKQPKRRTQFFWVERTASSYKQGYLGSLQMGKTGNILQDHFKCQYVSYSLVSEVLLPARTLVWEKYGVKVKHS